MNDTDTFGPFATPQPEQAQALSTEQVRELLEGTHPEARLLDLTQRWGGIAVDSEKSGEMRYIAQPSPYEDGTSPYYKGMSHWLALARDLITERTAHAATRAENDRLRAALAEAEAEQLHYKNAAIQQNHEIEQTLGKALGFPWYKDDQKNFPGATEADGVCTGPYVAEVLAVMAAEQLAEAEARIAGVEALADDWAARAKANDEADSYPRTHASSAADKALNPTLKVCLFRLRKALATAQGEKGVE